MKQPILLGWSGGKDSCLALAELSRQGQWHIVALVTTITEGYERVSMHGVRVELLRQQADSLGATLVEARIPPNASNLAYEASLSQAVQPFLAQGVRHMAFGDLFLEDIRRYRESLLARWGLQAVFPLWGRDTTLLSRQFIQQGFRALIVCVDPQQVPPALCGRPYDLTFLSDLPPTADPCGENGEFHTFVYDGPIFRYPIAIQRGALVQRQGLYFCDLLPHP
ncbi:MAG: ATP-binding protein [Gemmatales bacterium]|nr:adenine nucleotide alpha hydrolase [Gemmatales bacterium]MDW7995174.1 ATP-binding protein [Gemmatales bacterium]